MDVKQHERKKKEKKAGVSGLWRKAATLSIEGGGGGGAGRDWAMGKVRHPSERGEGGGGRYPMYRKEGGRKGEGGEWAVGEGGNPECRWGGEGGGS